MAASTGFNGDDVLCLEASWLAGVRAVVVVAHPDDETLGCAVLLSRLRDARVVHVTDGAPRNGVDAARHGFATPAAYAAARRQEAEAALALAGVPPQNISSLGIVDQDVSLHLADAARRLVSILEEVDLVLTHAYEGGHSDHDAVAFAVHAACRLGSNQPRLVEMPFYYAGAQGWIRQAFQPHPAAGPEAVLTLEPKERAMKRRMIAAYRTQAAILDAFELDTERFRRAPAYDFSALPHDGPLLYERHGWNLTGSLWIDRTTAASAELGLVG